MNSYAERVRAIIAAHEQAEVAFGKPRDIVCTKPPKMNRPACPYCGARFGQRAREERRETAKLGQPIPVYRGNGYVLSGRISPGFVRHADGTESAGVAVTWNVWDGESLWLPRSAPFCSNPCAVNFGRSAIAAGYRIKPQTVKG